MTQGREAARALSIDAALAISRSANARRGALRAGVLLSIVCAVCLAGAVALVFGLRPEHSGIAHDSAASDAPARASEPSAPAATESPAISSVPAAPRAAIGSPDPAPEFEGRGVIRGRISAQPGRTVPQQWKLSIYPNKGMRGHERAESRTIEFTRGEETFRIDDLPLGGYGVRAEAGGLNCLTVNVLLVRGAENQFVSLVLAPAGYVLGSLLDANDRPAEGVLVTLEARTTHARRTLETDIAGGYRFDDVTDGEYTLYFGRPEAPILPPDALAVSAPSLTVPERKLPATGVAEVWTRDEYGAALADAAISGFSAHAGVIDARSGRDGSVTVRHLPAGRYRLHARLEDGRSGTAVAQVTAGETTVVDIRLEK